MEDNNDKTKIFDKEKQNIIEYEEELKGVESYHKMIGDDDNSYNDRDNRIKVIIILLITIIVFLLFLLGMYILYGRGDNTDNNLDEDVISEEKFSFILNGYAEAVTSSVTTYMENNNKKVPLFSEIESTISFPNYDVTCKDSIVNYDGSIYLNNCSIDGYSNKFKYTYGKKVEKPKESKNKIYIYQNIEKDIDLNLYYALNTKIEFDTEYPKLVDTYNCDNEDCIGYHPNNNKSKVVVIKDGDYYFYNPVSKSKKKIEGIGTKNYSNIDIINDSNNKPYALYLNKEDGNGAYYLVNKSKIVTDFIYNGNYTTPKMVSRGYFAAVKSTKNKNTIYLINQNTGEEVNAFRDGNYIKEVTIGDNELFLVSTGDPTESKGYFLNEEYDYLIEDFDNYKYSINSNDTITVLRGNTFITYDNHGNYIFTSNMHDKVLMVINDYVIVEDQDVVNIVDLEDNVVTKFFDKKQTYSYVTYSSGWNTIDNKTGIYFMVEDTSVEEGKNGRGLRYYYIPETKELGVIKSTFVC